MEEGFTELGTYQTQCHPDKFEFFVSALSGSPGAREQHLRRLLIFISFRGMQ